MRSRTPDTSTKQVCRFSLLSNRNVRWSHRMLPPGEMSHGKYADGTDRRRTDRWTSGVRPLHYAFRYGRGQRNKLAVDVIRRVAADESSYRAV